MALSPADPYYRAEAVPQSIEDMAAPLCHAYGVGPDAFGDKGNTSHTSGYHRSRNWVLNSPDSAYGSSDYSVRQSRDHHGDGDWISAFDFTPGVWGTPDNRQKMITLTKRLRAAARANDPRLADLREIAGTEDGRSVVTFYAQGGEAKDPFDSSHLDHLHGSFWRDSAANNHQGVIDVMLGTGGDEDDMGQSSDPITILKGEPTSLTLVGTEDSGADPRPQWLRLANDTFGHDYALRLVAGNGAGGFRGLGPNGSVFAIFHSGVKWSIQLNKGETLVSIVRCGIDKAGAAVMPADDGSVPEGVTPPFGGHLTCLIERGPVIH